MTGIHRPTSTAVATTVLAASATFFTLLSWDGLSDDASAYLVPLFWCCLGIGALGLALRALRTPAPLVPLVQLTAVALVLHRWWAPDGGSAGAFGGWLSTPSSLRAVVDVLDRSVEAAGRYSAPVPASEADLAPVMILIGVLVAIAVDTLACTLRSVPLAGLPLLAVFTVPVSLAGGVPWLTFALAAASFVLLLAADQAARLGSWGRNLSGASGTAVVDTQPREVRLSTLGPKAGRIGVLGIGIAVLTPLVLPATDGWFAGAGGPGSGDGGNKVRIDNPFVDIRRDLTRGADLPLIRVQTDDPAPAYLRLTVLDEFDGSTWRPSERDIPAENRAAGELPEPDGLSASTPRTAYDSRFFVSDQFESTWLPTPFPASEVRVEGDWRFDDATLDVMSADEDVDTAGLNYEARGLVVRPGAEAMVRAPAAPGRIEFANTRLPSSMPPWLEELAAEVTAGARSRFERAVMLQDWFRQDGGFEYSLESASGNGVEQLEQFLGTGPGSRVGYCEQFSSAMAMMARTLDIPARVAVGFLRPEPVGRTQDTWEYSYHDLHAWPELYFEGAGWVRFEPTPQTRAASVPGYTAGQVPDPQEAATPSPEPTTQQDAPRDVPPEELPGAENTDAEQGGAPTWLLVAAGALALAGVVAAPRLLRSWMRRRRYAGTEPVDVIEGAWAEVRATALDLGVGWDDGATLRRRAQSMVPLLKAAPVSRSGGRTPVESLETLVLMLERSRYSRTGLHDGNCDEVRELTETVTRAMRAGVKPARLRRATWLPASLWSVHRPVTRRTGDGTTGTTGGSSSERTREQASGVDRVLL